MKKWLLLFTFLFTHLAYAQHCNCSDHFTWLRQTFEENDAGFHYVIERKGKQEYQKHNMVFTERVSTIRDKEHCAEALSDWLKFFRSGHLWIGVNPDVTESLDSKLDPKAIRKFYSNHETYPFKEKEFEAYLAGLKTYSLEGVWETPPYKIGVRKVNDTYIGFIIEADGAYWSRGQVKLKITETQGKLTGTYFMRDHSAKEMQEVKLVGNHYLQIGTVALRRLKPAYTPDPRLDDHIRLMNTEVPLFEKISASTVLLRIPSFNIEYKKLIDSVIDANIGTITTTRNLILDLRNNGGGSDASFQKLIPLIYTNPIRTVGVEFLSTPLNNQRMQGMITDPAFSEEDKKWARTSLEKLNRHIGEFVNMEAAPVTTDSFATVYRYPENVGIIINEGNGSTSEQFLLAAKQSKKVKLFGTNTMGVLDISNMHFVNSPCNELKLGYSLSRSMRIPDMSIDGKGIQPDYYIDRSVSEYGWVEFVNEMLNRE